MSFVGKLQRAREILAQQGRLSTRALERELETGGDELDELVEELVDVQQVARREGKILIWTGGPATPPPDTSAPSPRTTPTQRAADQSETRKVISILFADLMGSTALQERLDPESVNRVMDAYYRAVRVPVEAAGGTLVQLLGDGVLCAFGIPRIAEDDALRAVRAAMGIQEAFREFLHAQKWLTEPIGLRVAVNTGEVVVSDEHPAGIGDPLNVAARLQQEARDGEVLIGQATRRLVADAVTLERAGTFALKGRAETVTAYRVLSLERPTGTTAAFVGRAEELVRLTAVYEAAVATPAARLAVLLGSPGLGKSRLIDEVGRRLADSAHLIAAHCDEAGGATFAPIAEALREWLNSNPLVEKEGPGGAGKVGQVARSAIEAALTADSSSDPSTEASARADRARVVAGISALLAGSPASPEETFFVIRRFLRTLAKEKPVVLVIDDLQWAEPLLLDLVEHLIQWGGGVPLFVAVGARPELRERRSSLATVGGFVSDVVTLSGLDAGAAMRLAANVIGAADLPAAVAAKVLASSEGNPLFVSELVRMLVDEGAIEMQGDRWTVGANLAALEMPPTIHALLAARLERLQPEERTVLERASVVGRHFSRGAVAALLGRNGSALDARLEALRRTELIEPDSGWLLGEPVLRFHHVLIRDAAYRRLLKGTRAELHERLANWIEAQGQEASEHDETIGRHLEQAHQLLGEIGPLDASAKGLGKRAAQRLSSAGRRALEGDDVPVAADLLGRAVDRLDHDDPARADLALDWCEALLSAGDVAAAENAIAELGRFAGAASTAPTGSPSRQTSRLTAWHTCFTGQLTVMTAPQELQTAADAVAAAANQFVDLDDAGGEAKAYFVHALALARLGRVGACEGSLDRALAAARRAGDRRRANTVLAIAPLAALWGPSPVTRASGRCLDVVRVLRITQGAPAVEAVALSCQGVLEALRGRTQAAHRMIASGRTMVEELGIAQRLFETDVFAGFVALLEGDVPAAERTLRGAFDGLRDLGLGIDAARAAALLARTLLAQDRSDEAEVLSHESEALAGDDLKAAIAWRGVRAEALARRGEHTEAIDLARAAVAIAATTDALLDHADARLALAAALRGAGRSAEADAEHRRAIDLWEAKGATLLAESARRRASPAATPVEARAPRVAHAPRRRPVRPNFAIEEARRAEAAVAARDVQALETLYRRDVEIVDHQFGIEYGHESIVERVRLTIQESTDGAFRHEDLATLGDFVALCRLHSTASGSVVHDVPFGATEVTYLLVIEADEKGCARRIDIFGEDALRDAVVRLYERYAALLPEGDARIRATATAQSTALLQSANADPERLAPVLAPDIEGIDHRHLSNWSLRGAPAYLDHLRALHQVADDVDFQWREVLALAPSAMLARTLHQGTERLGGGAYERWFLSLFVVGADGRFTRAEWFDEDREVEALARFEELVRGPVDGIGAGDEASRLVRRRVRPNAASALVDGIEAGFAARDREALERLLSEPLQTIEHPTGVTYGREGQLESIDRMLDLPDLDFRLEALATLGDGLCLARRRVRASGKQGGRFDVADYEMDHLVLTDVGEDGMWRSEVFSVERCGAAVVRLYELHGERLGEGPEAARSAGIARAVSAIDAPVDVERLPGAYARDLKLADHRVLATWSCASRDELAEHFGHQLELVQNFTGRIDDVLALGPTMLLAHVTYHGIGRDSGGPFENRICVLYRFADDGRVAAVDCYEAEREADALARFDALVSRGQIEAPQEIREEAFANTAQRMWTDRLQNARSQDWTAFRAALSPNFHYSDRRRLVQVELDGEGYLTFERGLADMRTTEFSVRWLATRGDRLALAWLAFDGEDGDVGPSRVEFLNVVEVDDDGRCSSLHRFDADDPDAAFSALDRLYDAGDGRHDATWPQALHLSAALSRGDVDPCRAMLAPGFRVGDHRKLGWGDTLRDADTFLQAQLALSELSPDWRYRIDHHRARGRVQLGQQAQVGTREGGPFENPFLVVAAYDKAGLVLAFDIYDADQLEQAQARFQELAGAQDSSAVLDPVASFFSNAAVAAVERGAGALAARNWEEFRALFADDFRNFDRRALFRVESGRDEWLTAFRPIVEMTSGEPKLEVLATRGDRLALVRMLWRGAGGDVGPSEIDWLLLIELGIDGRHRAVVTFDAGDTDSAYAELDERFESGEGASIQPPASALLHAYGSRDWEAMAAFCAPGFAEHDRRRLSVLGTTSGPEAWVRSERSFVELAPDTKLRLDHVIGGARGSLSLLTFAGAHGRAEYEMPFLVVAEPDSSRRLAALHLYDPEQLPEARAKFEAIRDSDRPRPRVWNRADAFRDRIADAWHARDWPAIEALLHEGFRFSDRRPLIRLDLGRDGWMEMSRRLGDMHSSRVSIETIATRGERLVLWRVRIEVAGGDVGPSLLEHLNLFETNDAGDRLLWAARFEATDVAAAYAELDARYEAGEAAAAPRNWPPISGFVRAVERRDWDAVRGLCRHDFVQQDHRGLAILGRTEGADAWVDNFRTLVELAPDSVYRVHHIREAERGYYAQGSWLGTREGGPYEIQVTAVLELDDEGRFRRADIYDDAVADAAFARLAELGADRPPLPPPVLSNAEGGDYRGVDLAAEEPPPGPLLVKEGEAQQQRFANAATRAVDRGTAALAAREFRTFAALMAPGFRHYDRTRIAQLETDGREWLESNRRIVELTSETPAYQVLATRGERLALFEILWRGAGGDVGPSEIEQRLIVEANEHGEHVALVVYDPEDIDAAYAELDARYEAEQGDRLPATWTLLRRWARAVAERDWEAVASLCADDLVEHDHRTLSLLGVTQGVEPWVQVIRTVSDLAPDSVFRVHHFIPGVRGYYEQGGFCGTREGGPFEIVINALVEIDDQGLLKRVDLYDDDRVFASPRWAELGIPLPWVARKSAAFDDPRPTVAEPNAASAVVDRWLETYRIGFETGDWTPMRELCAPGCEYGDRRRMVLLEGDVELLLASVRERAATGAKVDLTSVGTAGDRVSVQRVLWSGGPADGRFEIEYLAVSEVAESGRIAAFVLFDLDDARAAQREAWARWAAIDPDAAAVVTPLGKVIDAFNKKNAAKWRAAFANDLVVEDHRLAGMGRIVGADAYTESVVALWKLAPVTRGEMGWRWFALGHHGAITVVQRIGTVPDGGGDFENEYLYLYLVAQGRITYVELFEMDALDTALARFEELRPPVPGLPPAPRLRATGREAGGRKDTLPIPPNVATRGIDRWTEALLAGDRDAVVALLDPSYTLEDRRRLFRTVTDRNAEIAGHLPLIHEGGWQPARTVLATAGDRLALQRWLWTKGESDARSEVEFLEIDELGDSGRFVRSIIFDPEDRAAASRELLERYIATGADGMPHGSFETMRAWNEHDLQRVRDSLSADFVLDDHRLAGMERLEGPDAYVESVAALFELIPDARTEFLYFVAIESHGRVSVHRTWGLNREGGEVESFFVLLTRFQDGKVSYLELFEVEHLYIALARLADLRLGRTNAATRARERQAAAFVAQDWSAVRRLATVDFVYEDRGKRALVTGDVEAWVASMRFTSQPGFRPRIELIGTFGDRVALDRVVWSGEPGGDAFEFERIRVLEADAAGHMRAVIMFDPEDQSQASQEAMKRFAAAERAEPVRAVVAWAEAQREKRWDDLRSICTPDLVAVDHRPLGVLGTLDREEWVESLKAIDELSDDLTYASYDVLAWNDSAIAVAVARTGTITDGGGEIHDAFLGVMRVADGRLQRLDVFAEHDTEGALACFEGLATPRSSC